MGSAGESRPVALTKPGRRSGEGAAAALEPSRNTHGFRNSITNADSEANNSASLPQASSSTMRPISFEESEEDAPLKGSDFLSKIEVTRRRYRRDKQLIKLYKRMYWALMEEARVRFRSYYWTYGRSPEEEEDSGSDVEGEDNDGGESGKKRDRDRCAFPGCKTKPMALTMYCHPHILSDPRQKLYKPCSFPIKSSQSGPVVCGKPILCAPQLSYCPIHIQKAQKNVSQALRRAGLVHSSSKPLPKINAILVEYVRQIQEKRKEAIRALEMQRAADDEVVDGEDMSGDE